jgi:hypothetical protein
MKSTDFSSETTNQKHQHDAPAHKEASRRQPGPLWLDCNLEEMASQGDSCPARNP